MTPSRPRFPRWLMTLAGLALVWAVLSGPTGTPYGKGAALPPAAAPAPAEAEAWPTVDPAAWLTRSLFESLQPRMEREAVLVFLGPGRCQLDRRSEWGETYVCPAGVGRALWLTFDGEGLLQAIDQVGLD